MHTEIDFKLEEAPTELYSQALDRVQRALRRSRNLVAKTRVSLRDEEGPRPGARCRLVLETVRNGSIVVTARGNDAFSALSGALQRARYRLRRREERRLTRLRAPSARLGRRTAA